jgi:hypothetical protein
MDESNADKSVIQDLLETPERYCILNNKKISSKKIRLLSLVFNKRVVCDHVYLTYYFYYYRLYARYLQLHTQTNHVSMVYNVAAIL